MNAGKIKTIYFLRPETIAEKCFLLEALHWLAFHRFPLEENTENDKDARFDSEYNEGYVARSVSLEEEGIIPSEACLAAGLPSNPEYDAMINDEYYSEVATLEKMLSFTTDKEARKEILTEIDKSRKFEAELASWQELLDEYLELPKAKLYAALREGKLIAYGRLLPDVDLDKATEKLDEKGSWTWEEIEYQKIPADFWRPDTIDWNSSAARSKTKHYAHIYVEVDALFFLYPIPEAKETKIIKQVGNGFLSHDTGGPLPLKINRGGRPPLKHWQELQMELTRLLTSGELPKKQSACITHLQEWWQKNFGQPSPSESSIKAAVSKFYEKFKVL
jgi:hypothetical protein